MQAGRHQYIERDTMRIKTEKLYGDRIIDFIYSREREKASTLYSALTSSRVCGLLSFFVYDLSFLPRITGAKKFIESSGIDLSECVDDPDSLVNLRDVFERKIRYWETRPMPGDPKAIISPADARVLLGSFAETSQIFLKGKFFDFEELLSTHKKTWLDAFDGGDFAVFRLTPEKYHYNHTPVSGRVLDIYEIPGSYYPCNPTVAINVATPCSKNKRVVTIIDTDTDGGTGAGLVAMVEIVALMIGDIVQCYSDHRYDLPRYIKRNAFLRKGQPKSLYRPGSSTDVLLFQKGRVSFSDDLIENMYRQGIESRFSRGFGRSLVETDVKVRSKIATANR
jgi:phosphatidylserine decarboxylase